MKITKKIARRIALYDDATPTGGKAHSDEHLDEFMEEVGLPYGTSVAKINEALVECGIMPITEQQIIDNTMTTEFIISELEHNKRYYDLNGVEITTEDAENVIKLIQDGMTTDMAVDEILKGICNCLDSEIV